MRWIAILCILIKAINFDSSFFFRRCLPILSFVVFFGGKSKSRSRVSSQTSAAAYKGIHADGLRFASGTEDERRAALLAGFDEDDDTEEEFNPDTCSELDNSSQGGSGHNYRHISAAHGRDSVNSAESYDTTSTSHTVFRTTATTSEFSSSYRPTFNQSHSHSYKHHPHSKARQSESLMSGSVIVNALMWPIGSAHNPHRTTSTNSLQNAGSGSHLQGTANSKS